ncbi:MAG: MBL fold metallo-hydrolase [Planctomycetota bacterium]
MPRLPVTKRFVSTSGARIYRIPCDVLPDLSGRVYLVLGAGPPTLVDTGSGEERAIRQVLAGLETVRTEFNEPVRPGDIERILITHAHIDHFGGLWELLRHTKAEVAVHALDRRRITAFAEREVLAHHALARFTKQAGVEPERQPEVLQAFAHASGNPRSVPVDFLLGDGEELDGLRIVHTPGHSPGHVCIAVGNVLLAGDHILARTVPWLWPESVAAYTGLGHYLDSLDKVLRLDGIEIALGGHEPPIRDVPKRIREIRETHLRRLDRVLDILEKAGRPLSVREITEQMYSSQKGFHAMLALTDVGARVEHLDQRGHLAIANVDEVDSQPDPVCRYEPAR